MKGGREEEGKDGGREGGGVGKEGESRGEKRNNSLKHVFTFSHSICGI